MNTNLLTTLLLLILGLLLIGFVLLYYFYSNLNALNNQVARHACDISSLANNLNILNGEMAKITNEQINNQCPLDYSPEMLFNILKGGDVNGANFNIIDDNKLEEDELKSASSDSNDDNIEDIDEYGHYNANNHFNNCFDISRDSVSSTIEQLDSVIEHKESYDNHDNIDNDETLDEMNDIVNDDIHDSLNSETILSMHDDIINQENNCQSTDSVHIEECTTPLDNSYISSIIDKIQESNQQEEHKGRKLPNIPASVFEEGHTLLGTDKSTRYIVSLNKKGTKYWKKLI